ncbi:MAG: tetratricopeptide repeat protein [Candidatus Sericytochromatia bacterium]|nr:tetratricopeptide repeat protein [Candidatus Sericytochromatia bacterium]
MINKYLKTLLNGGVPEAERRPLEDGLAAYQQGRHSEALPLLEEGVASQPQHFDGLMALGQIHFKGGDLEAAQRRFLEALSLENRNATLYFLLGEVSYQGGRPAEALRFYQRATSVDADYTDAFIRMGMLHQEAGRLEEATKAYERAIFLDRSAVVARFQLAQVCISLGDTRRALTQLHLVKEIHGDYPPVFVLQGELQFGLGDFRQAIVEFERALELGVVDVGLLWSLSEAHARVGDKDQALEAAMRTLEEDPLHPAAHLRVAESLEAARRYTQALQHYETLLEVEGFDAAARAGFERVSAVLAEIAAKMAGEADAPTANEGGQPPAP